MASSSSSGSGISRTDNPTEWTANQKAKGIITDSDRSMPEQLVLGGPGGENDYAVDGSITACHASAQVFMKNDVLDFQLGWRIHPGGELELGIVIEGETQYVNDNKSLNVEQIVRFISLATTQPGPLNQPPPGHVEFVRGAALWKKQGILVSAAEIQFFADRAPAYEQVRRRLAPLQSVLGGMGSIDNYMTQAHLLTPASMRSTCELPYLKSIMEVYSEQIAETIQAFLSVQDPGMMEVIVANPGPVGDCVVYNKSLVDPTLEPALRESVSKPNQFVHSDIYSPLTFAMVNKLRLCNPINFSSWNLLGYALPDGTVINQPLFLQSNSNYVRCNTTMDVHFAMDSATWDVINTAIPAPVPLAPAPPVVAQRVRIDMPVDAPAGNLDPALAGLGHAKLIGGASQGWFTVRKLSDTRTEGSGLVRALHHINVALGVVYCFATQTFAGVRGGEGRRPGVPDYYDVYGICRALTTTPNGTIDVIGKDANVVWGATGKQMLVTTLFTSFLWDISRKVSQQSLGITNAIKNQANWGKHTALLGLMDANSPRAVNALLAACSRTMLVMFGIPAPYSWVSASAKLLGDTPYGTRAGGPGDLNYGVDYMDVCPVAFTLPTFCPIMFEGEWFGLGMFEARSGIPQRTFYDVRNTVKMNHKPMSHTVDGRAEYSVNQAAALATGGRLAPGVPAAHVHCYRLTNSSNFGNNEWTQVFSRGLVVGDYNGQFLRSGLFVNGNVDRDLVVHIASMTVRAGDSGSWRASSHQGWADRATLRPEASQPPIDMTSSEVVIPGFVGMPGYAGPSVVGGEGRDEYAANVATKVSVAMNGRGIEALAAVVARNAMIQKEYLAKIEMIKEARDNPSGARRPNKRDTDEFVADARKMALDMAAKKLCNEALGAAAIESDRAANVVNSTKTVTQPGSGKIKGGHLDVSANGLGPSGSRKATASDELDRKAGPGNGDDDDSDAD